MRKWNYAAVTVPFVNLAPQNEPLRERITHDIWVLVGRGDFTNGAAVAEFERAWADYCGAEYCVGVSSGLDALRLALLAIDLEPGREVVVPALTFQATWEAVTQAGLVPVPADVDDDGLLTQDAVDAAVTRRTVAVLPVHLYGRTAAVREPLTSQYIPVVEDACQSHGATLEGHVPGIATCFSFYPTKPLGAWGDAGAVVTDDPWLVDRARAFREHGQVLKGAHEFDGWTARLDTLQALVLLRKLPHLDGWNRQRRDAVRFYNETLEGFGDLRLPPDPGHPDDNHADACHVYAVRTANPDGLVARLAERGVGTGRHYPVPPHLSPAYAHLGHNAGEFPVAERIARETLSLPLWPGISEAQQVEVADAVKAWFDG